MICIPTFYSGSAESNYRNCKAPRQNAVASELQVPATMLNTSAFFYVQCQVHDAMCNVVHDVQVADFCTKSHLAVFALIPSFEN